MSYRKIKVTKSQLQNIQDGYSIMIKDEELSFQAGEEILLICRRKGEIGIISNIDAEGWLTIKMVAKEEKAA